MKKIIIILIILLSCACTDYKELNELGIVEAIGIEKENDKFTITSQVINISTRNQTKSSDESTIYIYKGSGTTLFEALRSMSSKSPKKLYYAHIKVVIFDKSLFKNDIEDALDLIIRDTESMINFNLITSVYDKPSEILETLTPFSDSPAESIASTIQISEKNIGNTNNMLLEEFLTIFLSKGIEPVYTNISLTSDSKNKDDYKSLQSSKISSYIKLGNLVTYKDGNPIIFTKEESIGYNYIKNNIESSLLTLPCDDKYYTVEMFDSSSSLKENLKNDEIIIIINSTVSIAEYNCSLELTESKTYDILRKQISDYIEEISNKSINLAKSNNIDFLGIGNFIYKEKPDYFNFDKNDWNTEGLNKIKIKVNSKIRIIKQGNLNKSLKEVENNE